MSYQEFDPKKEGGAVSSTDVLTGLSSIQFIPNNNGAFSNSPPNHDFSQSTSPTKFSNSPPFGNWLSQSGYVENGHYLLGAPFNNVNQLPLNSSNNSHNNSHGAPMKNKWDQPDEIRSSMPRVPSFPYNSSSLPMLNPRMHMESFVPEKVTDFKHVIYNLLVDNHNNPEKFTFVQPCSIKEKGQTKIGFCFNEKENPDKKLPELYALHIRKARLDMEDSTSVFIQDLYKYYLRACVELLSKYFEKLDKYTYLYEDIHLFLPNGTLDEAEQRMKSMKTRSRKKRMRMAS